jgi:hypothetical protein
MLFSHLITKYFFSRYTVGKITPVPLREVRSNDFGPRAQIRMYFPCEGSQYTPPHCSVNFFWKDYCPMAFRYASSYFAHCIEIYHFILSDIGKYNLILQLFVHPSILTMRVCSVL